MKKKLNKKKKKNRTKETRIAIKNNTHQSLLERGKGGGNEEEKGKTGKSVPPEIEDPVPCFVVDPAKAFKGSHDNLPRRGSNLEPGNQAVARESQSLFFSCLGQQNPKKGPDEYDVIDFFIDFR